MQRVIQIDPITNEFIKEFESIQEASKQFNVSNAIISNICNKGKGTCCGYKWIYAKNKDLPIPELPNGNNRAVIQYSLDGDFIKEWSSMSEAAKALNLRRSNIGNVCRKIANTCGGYRWAYVGDTISEEKVHTKIRPVIQLTLDGKFIREFSSQKEAGEVLHIDKSHIGKVCRKQQKTCGGFKWMFK